MTIKINCYVEVKGSATSAEDRFVAGYYCVEMTMDLSAKIVATQGANINFDPIERSEIAQEALTSFTNHELVFHPDDFVFGVRLMDGSYAEVLKGCEHDHIIVSSSHFGKINEADLPFAIASAARAENTAKAMRPEVQLLISTLQEIADDCERRLRKGYDNGDANTLKKCTDAINEHFKHSEQATPSVEDALLGLLQYVNSTSTEASTIPQYGAALESLRASGIEFNLDSGTAEADAEQPRPVN